MAVKQMNLRARAILVVSIFLLATSIALGTLLTRQSRTAMKTLIDDRMLDIVNTAADMVDGDTLRDITEADIGTPEYQRLYNTLAAFEQNIGLEFIYTLRATDDGSYIIVVDPAQENASPYGELAYGTEALRIAGQGKASVDEEPYRDNYGYFYSAYSPVFDSSGKVAGVVAADFDALWHEEQVDKNTRTVIAACVLFTALGIAITMILTRQYSQQIESINESLADLARDLDTMTVSPRPASAVRRTATTGWCTPSA